MLAKLLYLPLILQPQAACLEELAKSTPHVDSVGGGHHHDTPKVGQAAFTMDFSQHDQDVSAADEALATIRDRAAAA